MLIAKKQSLRSQGETSDWQLEDSFAIKEPGLDHSSARFSTSQAL